MAIWKWSAVETAQRIKSGDVSCVEVTESHLARMDDINPRLNAVVVPMHDAAIAKARELDQLRSKLDDLPPLFGVPVTVKINVDVAGHANSDGVAAFKNNIASQDAPVTANLKSDGAVILGLTNTPEFSMRWFTSNELHGHTRNPWSSDITPGGSSGAAASAVAAGIGCIAHGNDMGGSLRYPAHCCGVSAIRPSFGRIASGDPSSANGRPPVSQLVSVQGPIARNAEDVRLGLNSMAKLSTFDPDWSPATDSGRNKRGRPLKIAYQADPFNVGVTPEVNRALQHARSALESQGHTLVNVDLPSTQDAIDVWGRLVLAEVDALQSDVLEQYGTDTVRSFIETKRKMFGNPNLKSTMFDLSERNRIRREWSLLLDEFDLVLAPVSTQAPFADNFDLDNPDRFEDLVLAQRPLILVNLLGMPSVAVPTGVRFGVPEGVQLIGAPLDDQLCLDAAAAVEAECGTLTDQLWQQMSL